jgi:hypothetical protein
MLENGGAIRGDVLVEQDASAGAGQQSRQRVLADEVRMAPQILAVMLDEVTSRLGKLRRLLKQP